MIIWLKFLLYILHTSDITAVTIDIVTDTLIYNLIDYNDYK